MEAHHGADNEALPDTAPDAAPEGARGTRDYRAAFDFRAIFRRATQYPGMTVIVWLVASVLGTIIALAGLILVGIGILFTLPYAFALSANLYGQFAQRTQSAASAAPAL